MLVLGLALAAFAPRAHAEGATASARADARIILGVVIPAVVRVKAMSQPRSVRIDGVDVARGYVDVDDSTSMLVTSNSALGFTVSVTFDEQVVSRVLLRVQNSDLAAPSSGTWVHIDAPRMIEAPLRIGYRLFLARDVHEGTYRWPVALSFGIGA